MQFTDSHIHLQDYKTKNTQQIISELRNNDFAKLICVSSQPADFAEVARLTTLASDLIIPAFGIHPWYLDKITDNWLEQLRTYLLKYPQSIIGECGIDRLKGNNLAKQTSIFREHIKLASKLHKPLNIHLIHSEDIFAGLIKEITTPYMIHSFYGSMNFLDLLLRNNAYISLNPKILLRPRANEIIRTVPLERLLTESDAPFQSDYCDIPDFIRQISVLKSIPEEEIIFHIQQNLQNFIKN